ncbi:phage tail protein [Desulfococcus sp.]|uniref:phage tail protein n=1 Tax=Desulfococcus sp. TaxID=2025834 RepID=UPI003594606E
MKQRDIEGLLPHVFQQTLRDGGPLNALLGVMDMLHEPVEKVLANLAAFFNPHTAPDMFVPYLACWMDLDRFFPLYCAQAEGLRRQSDPISSGNGRLRELIAAAAFLSQWRGTAKGLKCFLEIATGVEGFQLIENRDQDGNARPFHVRIILPGGAEPHRALIERIVAQEKPAYVSYELESGPTISGGEEP